MFLGVDIGTSGVKAVVLTPDGVIAGQSVEPLRVSRPQPLWSEQDPADWWSATQAAVAGLPPNLRKQIRAIGLAGQMHGATLLDAGDRPLRPAILWNDGRSFAECSELERAVPDSRAITGNLAMPGFTAPKLLWVRSHEPEVFARLRAVLLPKDYVRLCMTGDKASDVSDSAGTLWLDVRGRRWSDSMLDACGLSGESMPTLHEGSEITGVLRPDVAADWGMDRVPVAAGGGDNAAAAAGVGVIAEGDALLSLGTSGVIFAATAEFRPNPDRAMHTFCHCISGMWHQMAVHLSAASCIDWGARLISADGPEPFFKLAEAASAGTGPELFLPYLSGERTPHNDPHVRGAFLALDNDTGPGQLAAAVLEGVAFALTEGLQVLKEAGTPIEELVVVGGGARSRYWGSIIASALGVRLLYLAGGEVGPSLGAAKLAHMAATGATAAVSCTRPPVSHAIDPDPALAERLAAKFVRFQAASAAIRAL